MSSYTEAVVTRLDCERKRLGRCVRFGDLQEHTCERNRSRATVIDRQPEEFPNSLGKGNGRIRRTACHPENRLVSCELEPRCPVMRTFHPRRLNEFYAWRRFEGYAF